MMSKSTADFKYTVFEREGYGWYFQYGVGGGKRSSMMSVKRLVKKMGLESEYPKLKNRKMCERIVVLAYERGFLRMKLGSREKLADYLMDYWDFNGQRIRRKNRMVKGKGHESVSENYASIMQGYIKNHVVPRLRKDMTIEDVTPRFVRDFMHRLVDKGELANATIDKIMVAFTKPLRDAWKDDLIHENPTKLLDSIDTTPEKMRGILTRSEFQKVLVLLRAKATEHTYLAVLLAAATGMRLGEIRALSRDDITVVNEQDSILTVSKSWSVYGGEKSTKGKKVRYVPCPTWLAEKLLALGRLNSYGTTAVFWSIKDAKGNPPVSSSYLRESFYKYLYDVLEEQAGVKVGTMVDDPDAVSKGIKDKDGKTPQIRKGELLRRERNISFHSFRHFFNTEAQALGADGDKLRLTVGHESKAMTDNYTHAEKRLDMVKSIADISHLIVGEAEIIEEQEAVE
jgi:integrase